MIRCMQQDVVEVQYWQLCWLESSLPDKNQFAKSLDGISYSAVITREPDLSQILSLVLVDEGGDTIRSTIRKRSVSNLDHPHI